MTAFYTEPMDAPPDWVTVDAGLGEASIEVRCDRCRFMRRPFLTVLYLTVLRARPAALREAVEAHRECR